MLSDITEEELSLGVVYLTGGHDLANSPLLSFPVAGHCQLEAWSSQRLERLLRYFLQWLSLTSQVHTLAFLADLRKASKTVINVIVEAVEKLELGSRGTVSALYFLKPENKTRSRVLKKLLGLKPSKKHAKMPLFKAVLLKSCQTLWSQIDVGNLTSDFGGTLNYDHPSWVTFHELVAPCVRQAGSVLKRVPELRDKVELLQDYEVQTQSVVHMQTLLTQLTQTYQLTISEAQFEETLDLCKQTLLQLDNTELSEHWLTRIPPLHVKQASACVRHLYNGVSTQKKQLDELWRGIEENVTVHLQMQRHRERAAEITRRMNHYEALMEEHPCVGSTLSQAELYRTHFTTTLYEPAKELLNQATEILEDVQRLQVRTTPPCDVTSLVQQLTVALQPFTRRLQSLQDIYVAVHIFHLLFQKALTWYRKVLKFLPSGLEQVATKSNGSHILQLPVEWHLTVQSFLSKHPPPREEHLARLDADIPPHVDKSQRAQARSLALRLRLLQRLLYSRRSPANLLATIFKWKAEVNGSSYSSVSTTPRENERPSSKFTSAREETSPREAKNQDQFLLPPKAASLSDTLKTTSSLSSWEARVPDVMDVHRRRVNGCGHKESSPEEQADSDENTSMEDDEVTCSHHNLPKSEMTVPASSHGSRSAENDPTSCRGEGGPCEQYLGSQTEKDERFVRLTFSPSVSSPGNTNNPNSSVDSEDLSFRFPDVFTGSESGIEVAEAEDPWDSIINRIKAVSNSNLPNSVKIQCMTHLLACRKRSEQAAGCTETSSYQRTRRQQDSSLISSGSTSTASGTRRDDMNHNFVQPLCRDCRSYHKKEFGCQLHSYRGSDVTTGKTSGIPPDITMMSGVQKALHREHEKPAHTVARLRRRLARSLVDLDDHQNDHVSSSSENDLHKMLPRILDLTRDCDTNLGAIFPDYISDVNTAECDVNKCSKGLQTRSGELGQDTVSLDQHQNMPNALASWKSLENGLNSSSYSQNRKSTIIRTKSGSLEDTQHPKESPEQQHEALISRDSVKNPYRWRQAILNDCSAAPTTKTRRKSTEFLAPSFLKPFRSMHSLCPESVLNVGHTGCYLDDNGKVRPSETGRRSGDVSDSFSETSRLYHTRTHFERLSDEMDQEYLSQDEVESSLKRSQRILMEAEDWIKQQRPCGAKADDKKGKELSELTSKSAGKSVQFSRTSGKQLQDHRQPNELTKDPSTQCHRTELAQIQTMNTR